MPRNGATATSEANLENRPTTLFVDPGSNNFHLKESAAEAIGKGVEIYNIKGVQIYADNMKIRPGISTIDFSDKNLPNGYYLLYITGKNENRVLKFQKV